MLLASARLGALLYQFRPTALSPSSPPQRSRTLLWSPTAKTSRDITTVPLPLRPPPSKPSAWRPECLGADPRFPANMFRSAVQNHKASIPPSPSAALKQQSIGTSLRTPAVPQISTAYPLTGGTKHNATGTQRAPSTHGIKRTSSGLTKSLNTHGDGFDYPTLSIAGLEKENESPAAFHNGPRGGNADLSTALFDENDFDSDPDLDVEDPATKGTVSYPDLSRAASEATWDSGYASRRQSESQPQPKSSQPIPWSSSPVNHFQTPPRAEPVKKKRRALPWAASQEPQAVLHKDMIAEEDEAMSVNKAQKGFVSAAQVSTPRNKESLMSKYAWNTTASALKQQQKDFREKNAAMKKAQADDEVEKLDSHTVKRGKKDKIHRIFLSDEQQNVLNLVVDNKKSVFFTGSAGTGKSVLLREIIAALRRKYIREPDRVAVTASTGLAACNIGGVTLHSFAGIGLGKEPAEDLVKKIRRNQKAKQRWMRTKVLIMDEVSMVDGDLFDKLEQIARTIRNNGRPFGGIQLVITGDFFQLPPVPEYGRNSKFAFDAGTWSTSIEHTIGLHHVFRQKDPVFANMLNEMREGRLTPESISRFRKLDRPLDKSDDSIEATELFPTRQEVDRSNTLRMQQLHGNPFSFEARDGGTITNKEQRDRLLQNCMVPEIVHLKKGAQVMLVKNMDETLVNGSLGKVTGFMTEQMFALYKEDEEAFLQDPSAASESALKAEVARKLAGLNTAQVYPVVRFAIADGTTRDLLCKREDWKVELPNGEVQASRSQIPLILAWALSIHKAQGQTLERVRVDLGRVFEKGQAYVALSRATSMAGLQILRFDPRKVIAHEKVRAFYAGLSSAEAVEGRDKGRTKGIEGMLGRA